MEGLLYALGSKMSSWKLRRPIPKKRVVANVIEDPVDQSADALVNRFKIAYGKVVRSLVEKRKVVNAESIASEASRSEELRDVQRKPTELAVAIFLALNPGFIEEIQNGAR